MKLRYSLIIALLLGPLFGSCDMKNEEQSKKNLTLQELITGEYDVHFYPPDEQGNLKKKMIIGSINLSGGEYRYISEFDESEIPEYLQRELQFLNSPEGIYKIELLPEYSQDMIVEEINFSDSESVHIGYLGILPLDGERSDKFLIYVYKESMNITLGPFWSGLFFWSIVKSH